MRKVSFKRRTTRCARSSLECAASAKKSRDLSIEKYSTRQGAQTDCRDSGNDIIIVRLHQEIPASKITAIPMTIKIATGTRIQRDFTTSPTRYWTMNTSVEATIKITANAAIKWKSQAIACYSAFSRAVFPEKFLCSFTSPPPVPRLCRRDRRG